MKSRWFVILLLGMTMALSAKAHSSRDTELVNETLNKGAKIIQKNMA